MANAILKIQVGRFISTSNWLRWAGICDGCGAEKENCDRALAAGFRGGCCPDCRHGAGL